MAASMVPPDQDEVEICLLGRGNGECVVVHLLENRWMVVDSFNYGRSKPAAVWYLESLGIDRENVEVVVVTHFHADHYRGIQQLFEWCSRARLFTTGALGRDQFVKARSSADAKPLGALPATIEQAKRRQLTDAGHDGLLWAQIGQIVWNTPEIMVRAMSPVAAAMAASDQDLGEAMLNGWEGVDSQLRDDNRSCVVLHLDVKGMRLLLCADMLKHDTFGWQAVLGDPLNNGLEPVDLVKAGHHGSITGHDDDMWTTLVDVEPVICVAPFRSRRLPTTEDIERMRALCSELWQAAPSDETWITEDDQSITARGVTGFVRARRRLTEDRWRTEAYSPGVQVHP